MAVQGEHVSVTAGVAIVPVNSGEKAATLTGEQIKAMPVVGTSAAEVLRVLPGMTVREQGGSHVRGSDDDVRRALIVEPGEPLRTGAIVELLLLPGITDAFATPLGPAAGADVTGAPRLLRSQVEG